MAQIDRLFLGTEQVADGATASNFNQIAQWANSVRDTIGALNGGGATGPTGPAGVTGPEGPTGPTGGGGGGGFVFAGPIVKTPTTTDPFDPSVNSRIDVNIDGVDFNDANRAYILVEPQDGGNGPIDQIGFFFQSFPSTLRDGCEIVTVTKSFNPETLNNVNSVTYDSVVGAAQTQNVITPSVPGGTGAQESLICTFVVYDDGGNLNVIPTSSFFATF